MTVVVSFAFGGFAGTDQSDVLVAVGVPNDQQPTLVGDSDRDEAVFVIGVLGIVTGRTVEVIKDGLRFVEGDAVLGDVDHRFGRVPLEVQGRQCSESYQDRITTRSPGNGAPTVGAYNAEGNAPTAGAELLRCNVKVIRRPDTHNHPIKHIETVSRLSVKPIME